MDDPRRILWLCRTLGPISPVELSDRTGLPMWVVKAILDDHARLGLIRREAHRWHLWDVTERGRLLCPACAASAALLAVRCEGVPHRRMADAARGLFGRGK